MKRRIVLIGPPGCGKGTFARLIQSACGYPATCTGAILRQEFEAGTPLGLRVHELTSQGLLAPDDDVLALVTSWLNGLPKPGDAFLFDGFPRTLPQGERLDRILAARGIPLDLVLLFDLSREEIERRILGRRVCHNCGHAANLGWDLAAESDPCPKCGGGPMQQREDDTLAVLDHRMEIYEKSTIPLIPYYEAKGILFRVDASLPKPEAMRAILEIIGVPRQQSSTGVQP